MSPYRIQTFDIVLLVFSKKIKNCCFLEPESNDENVG